MSLPPSVRLSVCLSVHPLLACLRDNLSHIQPLGTKFAPIMHLANLQTAFENGVDWPWPSRSFGTLKLHFCQFWACWRTYGMEFMLQILMSAEGFYSTQRCSCLKCIRFLGQNFLNCSDSNLFKQWAVRILGAPRYIIVIVYSVTYTGIFLFQ